MAQIFSAAADTRLRLALVFATLGSILGLAWMGGSMNSTFATRVGWPVDQPVPFSHQHHVAGLGIDCRNCHNTAEIGAEAGFPSTHTCMTCHSQIWKDAAVLAPVRDSFASGQPIAWHRVDRVPDYVFFNHAIHLSRGVPCVTCHGRIYRMPLTARGAPFQMKWCLDCHRDPGPHLRPPDQVTRMDWPEDSAEDHKRAGAAMVKAYGIDPAQITSCNTCHR